MYQIVIIGSGRLGRQLAMGLKKNENPPVQLFNRSSTRGKKVSEELNIPFTDKWDDIKKDADLYILAVSDHAIPAVAALLSQKIKNKLVVHTSGNTSINVLSETFKRYGLFYPLDTYTDETVTDFSKVPIILNTSLEGDQVLVQSVANILSEKTVRIKDEDMSHLHLGAVFANNFTNKIIGVALDLLKEKSIPHEVLYPLIETTFRNILDKGPDQSQTGPAARNDFNTIEHHLKILEDKKDLKLVYALLSKLINEDLKGKI